MKKVFTHGLAVLATLILLFFAVNPGHLNAQAPTFVETGTGCNRTLTFSIPNQFGPYQKADLLIDGVLTSMLGKNEARFGLGGIPLSAGPHTASWQIKTAAGQNFTGSMPFTFTGNGQSYDVNCAGMRAELFHPSNDTCKVGIKVFMAAVYTNCASLEHYTVFLNGQFNNYQKTVYPGDPLVAFFNNVAPDLYQISVTTTIETGNSQSEPFEYIPCSLGSLKVPPVGNAIVSCDKAAKVVVVNCEPVLQLSTPYRFSNCTYMDDAQASIAGPTGIFWEGDVSFGIVNTPVVEPNALYHIVYRLNLHNGTVKTCEQVITIPKSPIQVQCPTAVVDIIPGPTPCTVGMYFDAPLFTCAAYEWQSVKVKTPTGADPLFMAMSNTLAGSQWTWNGPVPAGPLTVIFTTSTWEQYEVSCTFNVQIPAISICCDDVTKPTVICPTIAPAQTQCQGTVTKVIPPAIGNDNCPTGVVSWYTVVKKNNVVLPMYDGATNGVPLSLSLSAGVYNVTYTATDGQGNSSTCSTTFTVTNTNSDFAITCGPVTVVHPNPNNVCPWGLQIGMPVKTGGCGAAWMSVHVDVLNATGANVWNGNFVSFNPNELLTTTPLPAGDYTVITIARNTNWQLDTCINGTYHIPPVVPTWTFDCSHSLGQVNCDGSTTVNPSVLAGDCGAETAVEWSMFTMYSPSGDSLFTGKFMPGSVDIPKGYITESGDYLFYFLIETTDGHKEECWATLHVPFVPDPCCTDDESPTVICPDYPDYSDDCDGIHFVIPTSKFTYSDNCADKSELDIELIVFYNGVPILTETNNALDFVAFPGDYVIQAIVTDPKGNSAICSDSFTVSCGNTTIQNRTLSVWPNPSTGIINVSLNGVTSATVNIVSMSGNIVATQQVTGITQLNLSNLPAGIYTVITTEATPKRIVVQR